MLYCYHTSGAKFVASRLCLVIETVYHVHIVLALRLPGVTVGFYSRIVAFYVQCLTIAGVSQPSSQVTKEIRISQRSQNYYVLSRLSFQKWRGPPTFGGKPGPTIRNKVQVAFLPAFRSSVSVCRRCLESTIETIASVIKHILTFIPISSSEIISQQIY